MRRNVYRALGTYVERNQSRYILYQPPAFALAPQTSRIICVRLFPEALNFFCLWG